MMERTEAPSDILPLYNAVEMNSAAIWKHAANLRYGMVKAKDYTRLTEVLGIETAMSNLSSVCENAFNYAEMLYRTQRETVVDAGELCENLAKRCNAALAKCGRRIEALIDPGSLYHLRRQPPRRCRAGERSSERAAVFPEGDRADTYRVLP